jgi:hypothetical protein
MEVGRHLDAGDRHAHGAERPAASQLVSPAAEREVDGFGHAVPSHQTEQHRAARP